MTNKAKSKGNLFEREIAAYLSKIYNKKFIRVPNSGAFTGGKNAFRKKEMDEGQVKTFRGDIIPPDDYTIVIECKNYGYFPFHRVIQEKEISLLDGWISEVETDAGDDFWLLFFKVSNKGTYVVWKDTKFVSLEHAGLFYKDDYRVCDVDIFFDKHNKITERYMLMEIKYK